MPVKKWYERQLQLRLDLPGEIAYWAGRWGITQHQLKDAIIDTGSVNLVELRDHLKEKQLLPPSPAWLRELAEMLKVRKEG